MSRVFEETYKKREYIIHASITQAMDRDHVYHAIVTYTIARNNSSKHMQNGHDDRSTRGSKTLEIILNGSGASKMLKKVERTLLSFV